MNESNTMKRLHEEIQKATKYVELLKSNPSEKARKAEKTLKGYVVGIQFALDVIVGGNARSILEGADEIMEDKK